VWEGLGWGGISKMESFMCVWGGGGGEVHGCQRGLLKRYRTVVLHRSMLSVLLGVAAAPCCSQEGLRKQ
jgi:hypothetical protein